MAIDKPKSREEILDYITFRASGLGQSKDFTFKGFYKEMLDMVAKERKTDMELIKLQTKN